MSQRGRLTMALGALFWAAIVLAGALASRSTGRASANSTSPDTEPVAETLVRYWTTPYYEVPLALPEVQARIGDPIFAQDESGNWRQAGYLTWTDNRHSATAARAVWHWDAAGPEAYEIVYHRNRGKFADIARMLLPPDKRKRIEELIRATIEQHGDEITEAIRPIVTKSLKDSLPVIDRSFRDSVARHRDELEALGDRYQAEVLEARLLPLVRDEIFPIVKEHGEPVAREIGQELWHRASLWRFAWRGLYDKIPFTERELLKQEWDRYVDQEAIPVLEFYTPDLIEAQKRIFVDVSKNQRIRDELRSVAEDIVEDRELRNLLTAILRETFVENQELRRVWIDNWKSAEAKAALDLAGSRLEPLVRQIGDELFGTRDGGVSPTFARVLRNQILGKDKRWFVAVPRTLATESETAESNPSVSSGPIQVQIAERTEDFPLMILATPEESGG